MSSETKPWRRSWGRTPANPTALHARRHTSRCHVRQCAFRALPPPAAFARNLRRAREKAGLSQEALAERAGMHRDAVALLETGKRDPRVSTVVKLAKALGMPAGDLLKGL